MYSTKRFEATIPVAEYLEHYVDVNTFLECCRACPNYDAIWSCPSYDFDVIEYWRKYQKLDLIAVKIMFDEAYAGKEFPEEEIQRITEASVKKVKQELSEELLDREQKVPGSISLSAGSCIRCEGGCTRREKEPCRFPDKMRYSIESLGGNVGLTISKLMGIELEWMESGKLPHYFVLVCGLLHS